MATISTRRGKRPAQSLVWLLWQEAFFGWGLPAILIGGIVCFALLGAFEQIAQTTGVLTIGGLLLVLICFFLFKPLLTNPFETKFKLFAWGLTLFWLAITCVQFYSSIFVGRQIMSSSITKDSNGLELSLGKLGTVYDLVIEGNFPTATGQEKREGGYTLFLEKDGQKLQEFTGNFSDTPSRQRLGRRGSTTTHRLHNQNLHPLISPGEGSYRLTVARIDPQLTPTIQASLYRDAYPQKTFWLLNVLLLIGAYIGETWQATLDIPLVLVTTSALTFVVTFHNIGVPPHSYQDIIGAFLIAALAGPLIGWLFRFLTGMIVKRGGIRPISKEKRNGKK